jgi:hypothetical protein
MQTLGAERLLHLWEQAEPLRPMQRALTLAETAGADPEALRTQPVGRTNAAMLELRENLLGASLAATASCPACEAVTEFSLDAAVLRHLPVGPASARQAAGEITVDWRAPTPDDLIAVASEPVPESALRQRCLAVAAATDPNSLGASTDRPDDVERLPVELVERAEQAMAAADPLAEVLVALTCPECEATFDADLDLGGFVWAEVDARARRLLHEVDVLARAYGWSEHEVLALSEHRRASYLRIVLDGAP